MKILFLDDNEDRHKIFVRANAGHNIHQAFNAKECIVHLTQYQFDAVFLDHDLGGPESEMQMWDNAEDGRYVARWIAENHTRFSDTIFFVHSLNPNGREAMVSILKQAGLHAIPRPFGWKTLYQGV